MGYGDDCFAPRGMFSTRDYAEACGDRAPSPPPASEARLEIPAPKQIVAMSPYATVAEQRSAGRKPHATLTVPELAGCSQGADDPRRRLEVHGGYIYGMVVRPPNVQGYKRYTLDVTTTVQWGQHAASDIASCKLVVDAELKTFIERCEENARMTLDIEDFHFPLKSSFWKDGWDVKATKDYEGPDLKLLRPGEAVRAQVRCGGLWVHPETRCAKLRWQLVELRRV